jgi:hypothetical protein
MAAPTQLFEDPDQRKLLATGLSRVPLHSLAHALMTEIALDCGYPASSLKERVYALSGAVRRSGAAS